MSNSKDMQYTGAKSPGLFSQFPKIWTMAFYSFRAQLRNPATFAFGFVFPIVFISVFGLIGNNGGLNLKMGIPDGSNTENPVYKTIEKIPGIKITRGSEKDIRNELTKGKLDGIVTISQSENSQAELQTFPVQTVPSSTHYSILLETTQANPTNASVTKSLLSGVVDKLNLGLSGVKNPPVSLTTKEVSGREFRFIDFALPGQIGFAILSTAIFGTAFGLIFLKKTLVLKRIFATPTRPISIILGQAIARLISALMQAVLIIVFGVLVFKFHLANGWITFFEMLLLSGLGLVVFLGFGLFISGIASDENSVAPLANLITLPQFLLSGSFFSIDAFPSWLQPISSHLPLFYLNEAMRKVATEGAGITEIWSQLIALSIWGIIAYFLASRTFKWQ